MQVHAVDPEAVHMPALDSDEAGLFQDAADEDAQEPRVAVARRSLAERSTPFIRQLPAEPIVAGMFSL